MKFVDDDDNDDDDIHKQLSWHLVTSV